MREFLSTGLGVVALVFSILGTVITTTGVVLATFLWPQTIGMIFLYAGGGILVVGVGLASRRLSAMRRRASLLEYGLESQGTIVELAPNPLVRVNGRRPWVVRYRYEIQGLEYQGRESMLDLPEGYVQGGSVVVIYDPMRVEVSALNREKRTGL